MIQFSQVSKYYSGKMPGLVDISVEIPDGEFVFLIGPSGSGKTTFLRLLIRDIYPSSGTITIDDIDLGKLKASKLHLLRRKVGIVFQDFKLLLDRTVYENIAIVSEILGRSRADTRREVMNVLGLVGLSKKENMFPMQLSAGEMQRVSIARAIVGGPKILLADEPTGNLDPATSWGILDILQEIHRLGTTIIMASHNADIVNKLKKRTLTIEHGNITRDEARGRYHLEHHHKPHDHHDHGKHNENTKEGKDEKEDKNDKDDKGGKQK